MYDLKDDTIIIGVSDVHLGALENKHPEFIRFLTDLNINLEDSKGKYKKLKALIILGDFFDIIMESIRDFCKIVRYRVVQNKGNYLDSQEKMYNNIFTLLGELKDKKVEVYFTLGNHEISILGNLDKKFRKRKEELLKEFYKKGFKYRTIFNSKTVWQYFMLIGENKKWRLQFYDSQKEIINSPGERTYTLGEASKPTKSYSCLMTHGNQFENFFRKYGAGIPWWIGLKCPDFIKEISNILYNQELRKSIRLFEEGVDTWLYQQHKRLKRLKKLVFIEPFYVIFKLFSRLIIYYARIKKKLRNESYINYIQNKFLPKLEKKGYNPKITNIVFGHTHQVAKIQIFNIANTGERVVNCDATNSGAWQQVRRPSLFEINDKGVVKPAYF